LTDTRPLRRRIRRWSHAVLPLSITGALATAGLTIARSNEVAVSVCRDWKVVASPTVESGILYGVSAVSSTDVWAAGTVGGLAPLIEHWEGATWTLVQQEGVGNELKGIAAIDSSDVWAVGNQGAKPYTLIQHWNGSTWSVVPSPSPGRDTYLYSVSAVSTNDVWAAGSFTLPDGTSVQPLFLHWDGTSWTQARLPVLPFGGIMYSIDALSSSDAWAVGYQATSHQFELVPLIEHWDGRRWRPVPAGPVEGDGDDILQAVTAITNDDVWAVGRQRTSLTLAQRWDGTAWTNVTIRNDGSLWGASAESTSDVWAVGSYLDDQAHAQASSEHWNGTAWAPLRTPHPNLQSYLFSVDATSGQDVWASGAQTDPASQQLPPLILHSRGPCP
jgi:hypothetical protein